MGALFDEVNTLHGKAVNIVLWDMEKFYDNVDILNLSAKAIDVEYPIMVFTLGIRMHFAPRAFKAYDCNAYLHIPSNGIIAGCVQSNYLATVVLFSILQAFWDKSTGPTSTHVTNTYIRTFVDDIGLSEAGEPDEVYKAITENFDFLAEGLREVGCVISHKTTFLASNNVPGTAIRRNLDRRGISFKYQHFAKDLGVASSAGVKRISSIMASRFKTAESRVKRIKAFDRVNRKACRLSNTGAWPQSIYGKEAMGLSTAAIHDLRTMAASAVSGPAIGKCPTTCIWAGLGENYDPALEVTFDQVNMWLDVAPTQDQVEMTKAWRMAKKRHYSSVKLWQIVKGPIGTMIATLEFNGWNLVSPFRWIDADGSIQRLAVYNECRQDLISAIREQPFRNIWILVATHQDGAGLQGGPDMTVLSKHLKLLRKQGENAKAGMLMCIASGGHWSQSRKHAAGLFESPICLDCGTGIQDETHRFWVCSKFCSDQTGIVHKTRGIGGDACDLRHVVPCFYKRGIPPRAYTQG